MNIATDLELSLLAALGREERMTDAECRALEPDQLAAGREAVKQTVMNKMKDFVLSAGKAGRFFQ